MTAAPCPGCSIPATYAVGSRKIAGIAFCADCRRALDGRMLCRRNPDGSVSPIRGGDREPWVAWWVGATGGLHRARIVGTVEQDDGSRAWRVFRPARVQIVRGRIAG